MVVNDLYYGTHAFTDEVGETFRFDEETVKALVKRIYEEKIDWKAEIDKGMFNETWDLFNRAVDEGYGAKAYSDPDYNFYQELRYNNAVFSAFRTHRLQNDIAAQLLDGEGKLKPFDKFEEDVRDITDHNVRRWLRTEYDTAILRARQAAAWTRFAEVRDVLPNLRWLPTTSAHPEAVHKEFWSVRLTLPQENPFWKAHRPGDRWNCHCSLEATDDPVTGERVATRHGLPAPDKGLDNNPAEDGKLFSDTHPYVANAYPGAKEAVDGFMADNVSVPEILRFILRKEFKNGGKVWLHPDVEKDKPDYKELLTIATTFAKDGGKEAWITPRLHFKSEAYKEIYGPLLGTDYKFKCPDLRVGDLYYEYEGFQKPWKKVKVGRMISHGIKQSSRIIINNSKGGSDRFIRKNIVNRLKVGAKIDEVWLYEKGKLRLFFKDGGFL
jgi:hypothetical protein